MATDSDIHHMSRVLRLAEKGLYSTHPNPRVGCLIIDNQGNLVGEGWHEKAGQPHAEINALNQAGDKARGGRVYVSLEPCSHQGRTPPCTQALINAGIKSVVVAMQDPNPLVAGSGIQQLRDAGIDVSVGVLQSEAEALNKGFISRMRRQRPYVYLKIAQSLDGRTAMANGESKWITGDSARQDVHRLRARSSAILTGIGTVLKDDPQLNVRLHGKLSRQPKRVIVDSQLRLSPTARVVQQPGAIVYSALKPELLKKSENYPALIDKGVEIRSCPGSSGNWVDLAKLVQEMASKDECNDLMVEAGSTLNGAMLKQQLVDEVWLYMAPLLMGSSAKPGFTLPLSSMREKIEFSCQELRLVGRDLRMKLILKDKESK